MGKGIEEFERIAKGMSLEEIPLIIEVVADSKKKFEIGEVVITRGVHALMQGEFEEKQRAREIDFAMLLEVNRPINEALKKHSAGNWGEICAEDREVNDEAVENGDRVMSAYTMYGKKVWVITEWDRSRTTLLLPEEY